MGRAGGGIGGEEGAPLSRRTSNAARARRRISVVLIRCHEEGKRCQREEENVGSDDTHALAGTNEVCESFGLSLRRKSRWDGWFGLKSNLGRKHR